MGTIKSAEIKPDIDPSLFPAAPKPRPTLPRGGQGVSSNQKRETSGFVPATRLIKGLSENHIGAPSQDDDDEYDDGYFAADGVYHILFL